MRESRDGDPVLGKALSVLPETQLFEPVRNLLHRGPRDIVIRASGPEFSSARQAIVGADMERLLIQE